VKGFKEGMKSDDDGKPSAKLENSGSGTTIEGEVKDRSKG
jgi:hypothetical protein